MPTFDFTVTVGRLELVENVDGQPVPTPDTFIYDHTEDADSEVEAQQETTRLFNTILQPHGYTVQSVVLTP